MEPPIRAAERVAGRGGFDRRWLAIPLAAGVAVPWLFVWSRGGTTNPIEASLLSGLAILGAAFLLAWAAEALQLDVSQGFALGLLALIAVLPEYAVDAVFAWKAAEDPSYAGYAVANMTGANRLLVGLGWSAIVLIGWLRHGLRRVELDRGSVLELSVLIAATIYAFTLPLKGSLSLVDTVILGSMFVFYAWATSRAPTEEPHLVGPAASLGSLPRRRRRVAVAALLVYAAVVILISAKPFAQGLVETGLTLGVDEFLLVQWLAPLASEAPEFIIAILFAWRAQTSAALRTLVSSKVNQWTLLIATLPLVYSIAKGGPAALPLDSRQSTELFLTAAQSLFATFLIVKLALNRREAFAIFALFAVQLVFPTDAVRWAVSIAYLVFSLLVVVRSQAIRRGLVELPRTVISLIGEWRAIGRPERDASA